MVNITGGCHCGAIRYQIEGEPIVQGCVTARIADVTPARRWWVGRCMQRMRSR